MRLVKRYKHTTFKVENDFIIPEHHYENELVPSLIVVLFKDSIFRTAVFLTVFYTIELFIIKNTFDLVVTSFVDGVALTVCCFRFYDLFRKWK